MASCAAWIARGTLFVGLWAASGCKGPPDRYPPPRPADLSQIGQGGTGGGGGGGAGGAAPLNACQCAYAGSFGTLECNDCLNQAGAGTCKSAKAQCDFELACTGFTHCPTDSCAGKVGDAQIQCIEQCYANPADEQAYQDFKDVMLCACGACADVCATDKQIACP